MGRKLSKRLLEIGHSQKDSYIKLGNLLWRGESSEVVKQISKLKVSGLKEWKAKQELVEYL